MSRIEAIVTGWPVDHHAVAVSRLDGRDTEMVGDTDHVFELASITKLITALVVHVAVEEGSIGLEDPSPMGGTIADLLAHSSGLGPDGAILAEPRTRRIYSNAGYERLAEMIGRATGITFDQYFAEVLTPLETPSITLAGSPAHGAHGALRDVHRLAGALAGPGLISRETVEALRQPHLSDLSGVLPGFGRHAPNPWGLGPEIRGDKSPHWTGRRNHPTTYGHFGAAGSFCWIDPDAELMVTCLTDRAFGDWALPLWPALSDAALTEYADEDD